MNNSSRPRPGAACAAPRRERGVVLIAALAVLLMLTILSIGMFRSFGLEERITGNSREKQHAFYAAQSAMQYAEQQLLSPTLGQPKDCLPGIILAAGTITVCDASTTQANSVIASNSSVGSSWGSVNGATPYPLPSGYTTSSASSGSTTYLYASPLYQVEWLGPDPSTPGGYLYQVTALGYGANANATSIVQSVFSVVPAVTVNTNGNTY